MNKLLSFFVVVPRIRFSSFRNFEKKITKDSNAEIVLSSHHKTLLFFFSTSPQSCHLWSWYGRWRCDRDIEQTTGRGEGFETYVVVVFVEKKNILQLLCFTQSLVSHLSFFIKKSALQLLETQCSNESTR